VGRDADGTSLKMSCSDLNPPPLDQQSMV